MQVRTWQEKQQVTQNHFEYKCDFCGNTSDNKYKIEECELNCKRVNCKHINRKCKFTYEQCYDDEFDIDYLVNLKGIVEYCCDCGLELKENKIEKDESQDKMKKCFELFEK